MHIAEDVDPGRIAPGSVLYPGTRLSGADLAIGPQSAIGADGPVVLDSCQIGSGVTLGSGSFSHCTILDGADGHLENVLIHYNYDSLRQFVTKQERYVKTDAKNLLNMNERGKPWSPISMPLRHFKWRFFDLEGYRDGLHGLWLSLLTSYYEGKKYALLARLWRQQNSQAE